MSPARALLSLAALGWCAAVPASALAAGGLSSGVHDLGSGGDAPKLAGTTLDGGLTNHEAHTHRVEELVILLDGHVEMLLEEGWREVPAGHLVFVASEVPHSLRNLGDTPAVYFAIQGH